MKQKYIFIAIVLAVLNVIVFYTFNNTKAASDPSALPSNYLAKVKQARDDKNKQFAEEDVSPIPEAKRSSFNGLNYFDIDTSYYVLARLEKIKDKEIIKMRTTQDEVKKFVRYARAFFQIRQKEYALTVFKSATQDYLFLPFRDLTSGETSYGVGRYIDPKLVKDDDKLMIIDFNKAYNPYCAYNSEKYNCPLPPKENTIDVQIKAGEKIYRKYD